MTDIPAAQQQGFNGGRHRFNVSLGAHLTAQSLPTAHACICALDLPPYPDLATTRAKLDALQQFGTNAFDETAGRPLNPDDH